MDARRRRCTSCSTAARARDQRFCARCGAYLDEIVPGGQRSSRPPPRASWALGAIVGVGLLLTWVMVPQDVQRLDVTLPELPRRHELAASESLERVPRADDVQAAWLQVSDARHFGLLLTLDGDGRFALDDRGHLSEHPNRRGTYQLEDDVLTFRAEPTPSCRERDHWEWHARVTDDGWLHTIHDETSTSPCLAPLGTRAGFVQLSPGSPLSASIAADLDLSGEPVTPSLGTLAGVWLQVGDASASGDASRSGLLLHLARDERFAVDDAGTLITDPAVTGTYRIEGDQLVFEAEGTPSCGAGERWTWDVHLHAGGGLLVEEGRSDRQRASPSGSPVLAGRQRDRVSDPCPLPIADGPRFVRVSPLSRLSAELDPDELRVLATRTD